MTPVLFGISTSYLANRVLLLSLGNATPLVLTALGTVALVILFLQA